MEEFPFELNGRIWMEIGGEKVLGHGWVELLERIQASGSIRNYTLVEGYPEEGRNYFLNLMYNYQISYRVYLWSSKLKRNAG
ncbi:hypothetical protein [Mucilaginibacter paludis]|uniref:Uncharacterized protein n=1 Tax=Mucilaginibacter paludis DSM 18603 TaxID=714943 RepID=H1YB81_9SPHI|nr:hypothetical protein [Mucilaginibacter paludis]EHQ30607.1 hypothetical protein Mucpa_6554 [Mucilaginibacter paludis DSM 18603]